MTLAEIETMVRRIEEFLERQTVVDPGTRKLAADFAAIVRTAGLRLNQCAAMLGAGDEHQAIQLAETNPALLDVITLASFRRSPNWRALCRAESLPEPDSFDLKAVRRLNDAYAKGIDADHALYRDYRRAVMLNDDVAALGILRSIARLNPNDQNAKGELDRLEKKQWKEKARQLETLARANNSGEAKQIAQLVDDLEEAHVALDSPEWHKALGVRAAVLIQRARESQRAGALKETKHLTARLATQRHLLDQPERALLDELEQWTTAETERRKEETDRKAAKDHLAALAQRLEQSHAGGHRRRLSEARAEADSLERAWGHVARFRGEINRDLITRVERLRGALDSEINRMVRASRRVAFLAVAAIVAVCVVGAWIAYSRQATKALALRIEKMVGERRVSETESALVNAPDAKNSQAIERARLLAADFLQREKNLKAAFDAKLVFLEQAAQARFTNAPLERLAATLAEARAANLALAPEFRSRTDAALGKVESSWNQFVDRERASASQRLLGIIAPVEEAAEKDWQYNRDPKDVLHSTEQTRRSLESAQTLAQAPILRPKQEALFRFETLQARLEKISREATNALAGQAALATATNLESFNSALQMLIASGFTPAPQRTAAGAIAGINLSSQTLLGPLLLPNAPPALLERSSASRMPAQVLPAEKEIQRRLRDDQNIHGVTRLEIEVKSLPADDPRRRRVVFLRGELQRRITRKSGAIYDPVENPSVLNFGQKEMGSLDYSVSEPVITPEKELYERAGLARLLDSNTGQYQVSLLQSLDEINQDRRANPLFRAYLYSRVAEMIDAQPIDWGAVWSPALARDRAELNRLGAAQIHSGDWFVPVKNTQRAANLAAFFDRAASHSYARESAFFKRVVPKAIDAGVRVVGYVSAEGRPVFTHSETTGAVWGLRVVGAPAEILMVNGQERGFGAPFSPLFVFAGNSVDLIDSALQELSYSAASSGLMENLPAILRSNP